MSASPDNDPGDEAIREARWPASIAVVVVAVLYLSLPQSISPGPTLIAPLVIALVVIPLTVAAPTRHARERPLLRYLAVGLVGVIVVFNVGALVTILDALFTGDRLDGVPLLRAGATVWLTNVIMFSLIYWELDAGGPHRRAGGFLPADWIFPQQSDMRELIPEWRPVFVDYLYISVTNSTAFSPTDAMPISARAKLLMGSQSLISLVTVALVAARAVNILH